MCGRFSLPPKIEQVIEKLNIINSVEFAPSYNFAPSQNIPVVRNIDDHLIISTIRWTGTFLDERASQEQQPDQCPQRNRRQQTFVSKCL